LRSDLYKELKYVSLVYLNGDFVPIDEAFVSVEDRGFLLGDACYEATPAYQGQFLLLQHHLDRLQAGLDAIQILFRAASLVNIHRELLNRNGLDRSPFAMVYVQVTRGVAPRSHGFPLAGTTPTVYAFAKELQRAAPNEFSAGSAAVITPDLRWKLPRIKSTNLLANVLAQQQAVESGAVDVVMHRDGWVTEGTHNNIFIVENGVLLTVPADDLILRGVTRDLVLDLARKSDIPLSEEPISLDRLRSADEIFFTGTTTEIRPTVRLDGSPVGDGKLGPVTSRVNELFTQEVERLTSSTDSR
jgi:D-alanine transaminase